MQLDRSNLKSESLHIHFETLQSVFSADLLLTKGDCCKQPSKTEENQEETTARWLVMAAATEISMEAAVTAALPQLDEIFHTKSR